MLFTQSLRKELFAAASAVFITLLTLVLTVSLVRILGQAATGRADPTAILLLIVLSSLSYLPILLALTAFISVLLVMTRLYRDSEMVVWFASGVSLQQFIRPVLFFVLPFVVLIWLFSLLLAPWANQQMQELRAIYEQRDDMARVSPGRFIESATTDRVFFVDGYDALRRTVSNVFVVLREPTPQGERVSVLTSSGGEIEMRNGERYVVLKRGRRYQGAPGSAQYSVMEFERYAVRMEQRSLVLPAPGVQGGTMTAQQLLTEPSPTARAQLVYRIGQGLLALNLALLAIPLSFVNPRAGRSANLLFALLLYIIYSNLLSLSESLVLRERLEFWLGLSALHVSVALISALMIWRRQSIGGLNPFSLRRIQKPIITDAPAHQASP